MRLTKLLFLAFLFTSACGSNDDAASGDSAATGGTATAQSAEEDLEDVGEYRLTMDKVDKYFEAQLNIARRAASMSPAERQAMEAEAEAEGDDGGIGSGSLDDMARKMEQNPVFKGALRDAGLTGREFAVLSASMMQSAMAAGVLQMRPNDNQDSLAREMKANMDNIRFMRENEAELVRKQQALAAEMERLGVGDDM